MLLIIVVATVSVGWITSWTTKTQISAIQMENGQLFGYALAHLLSGSHAARSFDPDSLQKIVRAITARNMIRTVDVVGPQMKVLASNRARQGETLHSQHLRTALRSERQTTHLQDKDPPRLSISTPIFARGRLVGAVRVLSPLGSAKLEWPLVFWLLMTINGAMIVIFLAWVLTRYVIHPVQAMQRAAAQVTAGDLSVKLSPQGAYELSSLAESFNAMTSSVKDQLDRLSRQQHELAASKEQLIRSEKLASVGRLAAGVAHEVGNPLQSIIGFSAMLAEHPPMGAQEKDFLDRIREEANRIHRIIRELLDYARPVEDAIEPVDLAALVDQSLKLVAVQQKFREIEVVRENLEELPPGAASAQRLMQVLVNLFLNAADAIAGEGTLTISGHQAEGRIELRISNSGPPIPLEDHGRIFDPFFTTKEPGQGTGLGLSVAQSIVESYAGRLTLSADTPQTTFHLSLHRWSESPGHS